MIVVDANVLFPLFISAEQSQRARELFKLDPTWCTEPSAMIEFSNILATYERTGRLKAEDAVKALQNATEYFAPHFLTVSNEQALDTALKYKITAYDARYILVAQKKGAPLITEDARLRAAIPSHTISLREALESRTPPTL